MHPRSREGGSTTRARILGSLVRTCLPQLSRHGGPHHSCMCFLLTPVQSCLRVEFFCLLPLWSQISSLKWSVSKQYLESRSTSLAPWFHLCLWTHWAVPGSWGFLAVMDTAIFLQGSRCLPRSEQCLLNIVLNISYFHNCIIQCSFDWNMIAEFHYS